MRDFSIAKSSSWFFDKSALKNGTSSNFLTCVRENTSPSMPEIAACALSQAEVSCSMRLKHGFCCNLKSNILESRVLVPSFFRVEFRFLPDLRQKDRKSFFVYPSKPWRSERWSPLLAPEFCHRQKKLVDAGLLYIVRREILYCFLKFYDIMEIGYI